MDRVGGSGGRFDCALGVEWRDRAYDLERHGWSWSLIAQRERLIQASPLGGRMLTRDREKYGSQETDN
jgi:hypothetical protein